MSEFFIPGNGIYPDSNDSYYGGYRTRTFTQVFSEDGVLATYKIFNDELKETPFSEKINSISNENLEIIFYLLYARYGNSHIAYSDETQFKYALFSTIFMYGPSWSKRLEIQEALRNLSLEDGSEIYRGGKAIYNHSYNPSTAPNTDTLEELLTINDQNTTNYKKSKIDGLAALTDLLETDITEEFIGKFKKLFIKVLAPDYPLLYENNMEV